MFRNFSILEIIIAIGLVLLGLLLAPALLGAAPAAPAVPLANEAPTQPHWQIAPIGAGAVYQIDTVTGHGYIVAPDGVLDVGTVDNPIMKATPRDLPEAI